MLLKETIIKFLQLKDREKMRVTIKILELLVFNFILPFIGLWQSLDFIKGQGKLASFFIIVNPISFSLIIIGPYFLFRVYIVLREFIKGFVYCNAFPGQHLCKHIHEYLIGSYTTIIRGQGPKGEIKPIKKLGSSSYFYYGGYADYLNLIKTLTKYSNREIKMTLPVCPYKQINDSDAYPTFKEALGTVRNKFLMKIKSKKKVIVLNLQDIRELKKELAKEIIFNRRIKITQYINSHYGRKRTKSNRLAKKISRFLMAPMRVDLKWSELTKPDEFLVMDEQLAILFEAVKREDGELDVERSKIIIDFDAKKYLHDFKRFENAIDTFNFFKESVIDEEFYGYCAAYYYINKKYSINDSENLDIRLKSIEENEKDIFYSETKKIFDHEFNSWEQRIFKIMKEW